MLPRTIQKQVENLVSVQELIKATREEAPLMLKLSPVRHAEDHDESGTSTRTIVLTDYQDRDGHYTFFGETADHISPVRLIHRSSHDGEMDITLELEVDL